MPFEVPKGWVWCKVEDIGEVITGNTPSKSVKAYYGGTFPFYKPTDLEQGFNTISASDSLTISGYEQSRHLPKDSVLITCIGATIGKTGIIRQEGSCNQQINAIIPNRQIAPEYLYYACVSDYFQYSIKSSASATTLPILNKNGFSKLLLPIPPIQEQIRIVKTIQDWLSVVDKVETNVSQINAEIAIAKSKILDLAISGKLVPQDPSDEPAIELLKRINPSFKPCDNSHYEELPDGWASLYLGDICNTINGLWKGKKESFVNVGVIRNANFTKDFKLNYSNIEYIDVEASSFAKRSLRDGDLIVEKSGGSDKNPVGRAILYEGENGKYSFSNFTMALRIKDCSIMKSRFLYYVIMAFYIRGDMSQMQTQTTGLHNLIGEKYLNMCIPVPPIGEQMRIVDSIEQLFASINGIKTILR